MFKNSCRIELLHTDLHFAKCMAKAFLTFKGHAEGQFPGKKQECMLIAQTHCEVISFHASKLYDFSIGSELVVSIGFNLRNTSFG